MIAIISDSHDNLPALRQMVAIFNELSCSVVIHWSFMLVILWRPLPLEN